MGVCCLKHVLVHPALQVGFRNLSALWFVCALDLFDTREVAHHDMFAFP